MEPSNNMERLEITWIENKVASTGTKYHKASLKAADGTVYEDVAIFKGYKEEELEVGATITGELVRKDYMGKPSYTLNAPGVPKTASRGSFTPGGAKALMEDKNRSIKGFQETKEQSIKLAGAQRDAVLLVTTFYKDANMDEKDIKEKVIMFRDWFLSDDFSQTLPF